MPGTHSGLDMTAADAPLPAITVVIPTRNRWHLLQDTLHSALAQRGVELEVVVVDEASTDETPERLRAYADRRVRVVRNERPLGVGGARNRGIAEVRTPWVAFLDDDDLWSPDKLCCQLEMAALAHADFVYSGVLTLDADRRPIRTHAAPPPSELVARLRRVNVMPATASNLIVKTARVTALSGFDDRLHQIADWDFVLRLADSSVGAAVAEVLVGYVVHPGSMRTSGEEALEREFALFSAKHSDDGSAPLDYNRGITARWLAAGYTRAGRRREGYRIFLHSAIRDRSIGNLACAFGAAVGPKYGDRLIATLTPDEAVDSRVPNPDWLVPYQRSYSAST